MFLFDAHLDLSLNAIGWNRDLSRPLENIRRREAGLTDLAGRGNNTVCFPEMRKGHVGICVATQIGHSVSEESPVPGWSSPEIAWGHTQAQLAWYRTMEERSILKQLTDLASLDAHVDLWKDEVPAEAPLGYILSLEGADSLLTLDYLTRAYEYGLRAIGPAHYGPGRYSPGTGAEGPLEPAGRELLREMEQLGMILDMTHMTDEAFFEALELFDGTVWASHNNCRELVPHQRQYSDDQIKALIERDAVIGASMDAWMQVPGWKTGTSKPEDSGLVMERIVDHIDHICQLAGSTRHCGVGSDLDGGFGTEQTATDLETIADLQKLPVLLKGRGYSDQDIEGIMHGNWLRIIRDAWK